VDVLTDAPDIESIAEHLQSGPYGRCVYDCDNDVVDNQVMARLISVFKISVCSLSLVDDALSAILML